MEEDDDFYGGGAALRQEQEWAPMDTDGDKPTKAESASEEEDDDDSDDDVQFTLEKPEGAQADPPAKPQAKRPDRAISIEPPKPARGTPSQTRGESQRPTSTAPPAAVKGVLAHNGKEGKDYPMVRTDNRDVNTAAVWPANGKPITEVDIDVDLAEQSKPWRLPGTDQTDYFNYGFDEYTWTQYCVRQQMMGNTLNQQKQEDAQLKAFVGGGANGGGGMGVGAGGAMPGMPPGMPMPDPQTLMEMVNQGVIPQEFAQQMMMGGMPGMGGPQQGQGFQSPAPQSGQGFQPPTGPSGGQASAFQQGNMEGYSPQQMAIMQDQQQPGQGGGGRGRNRRGRGFY